MSTDTSDSPSSPSSESIDSDTLVMPMPMDSAEVLQEFASGGGGGEAVIIPTSVAAEKDKTESKGWFKRDCTLRWSPTSPTLLEEAERRILSYLKTPHIGQYVDVGAAEVAKNSKCKWFAKKPEERKIWTVAVNKESKNTPLVLVHGLCAGVGLWALNLDELAKDRPVYAMDLLGFGRSSRPNFSKDASEAEMNHVEAIEDWRREVGLDKFVLLGHSMGGFISTGYALKYPERVSHLVLADPWGFPKKPENHLEEILATSTRPKTIKFVHAVGQRINALSIIRAAGPMGPGLIDKVRPDLVRKFHALNDNESKASVGQYIYHCNAQKPTGEEAFRTMMDYFGWAKNAMASRIHELSPSVPLTMIYGGHTWLQHVPEEELQAARPPGSQTKVYIIPEAGHHVYVDGMKIFNRIVNSIADKFK